VGRQHWHRQQPRPRPRGLAEGRHDARALQAHWRRGAPGWWRRRRRTLKQAGGRQAVVVASGFLQEPNPHTCTLLHQVGVGRAASHGGGGRDAPREEWRAVRLRRVHGHAGAGPRWSPPPGTQGSSPYGTGTLVLQALATGCSSGSEGGPGCIHGARACRAPPSGDRPALPACLPASQHAPKMLLLTA